MSSAQDVDLLSMLSLLKRKAMRSRVWYRALSPNERVLVGLAAKYIKQVRNKQLAIVLSRVVVRLSIAVNQFIRAEQLGFARAYAWLKGALCTGMGRVMLEHDEGSIPMPSKSMIEWFTALEMNFLSSRGSYG